MNWPTVRYLINRNKKGAGGANSKESGQLINVVVMRVRKNKSDITLEDQAFAAIKGEDGLIHMIPVDNVCP